MTLSKLINSFKDYEKTIKKSTQRLDDDQKSLIDKELQSAKNEVLSSAQSERAQKELDYIKPIYHPDYRDFDKESALAGFGRSAGRAGSQTSGLMLKGLGLLVSKVAPETGKDIVKYGQDLQNVGEIYWPRSIDKSKHGNTIATSDPWKDFKVGLTNELLPSAASTVPAVAAATIAPAITSSLAGQYLIGAGLGALPLELGDIAGQQLQNTGKLDANRALEYGIPAALLEEAVPFSLSRLGRAGKAALKTGTKIGSEVPTWGRALKNTGKAIAGSAIEEAATEFPQTYLEQAGGDKNFNLLPEAAKFAKKASNEGVVKALSESPTFYQAAQAGVLGGVTGGLMGAGAHAINSYQRFKALNDTEKDIPFVDAVDEDIRSDRGASMIGAIPSSDPGQQADNMSENLRREQQREDNKGSGIPFAQVNTGEEGAPQQGYKYEQYSANPTLKEIEQYKNDVESIQDPVERQKEQLKLAQYVEDIKTKGALNGTKRIAQSIPSGIGDTVTNRNSVLDNISYNPQTTEQRRAGDITDLQKAQDERQALRKQLPIPQNLDPQRASAALDGINKQIAMLTSSKDAMLRMSINDPAKAQQAIAINQQIKTLSNQAGAIKQQIVSQQEQRPDNNVAMQTQQIVSRIAENNTPDKVIQKTVKALEDEKSQAVEALKSVGADPNQIANVINRYDDIISKHGDMVLGAASNGVNISDEVANSHPELKDSIDKLTGRAEANTISKTSNKIYETGINNINKATQMFDGLVNDDVKRTVINQISQMGSAGKDIANRLNNRMIEQSQPAIQEGAPTNQGQLPIANNQQINDAVSQANPEANVDEKAILNSIKQNYKNMSKEDVLSFVTNDNDSSDGFISYLKQKLGKTKSAGNSVRVWEWFQSREVLTSIIKNWDNITANMLYSMPLEAFNNLAHDMELAESWSRKKKVERMMLSKKITNMAHNLHSSGVDVNKLPKYVQKKFKAYGNLDKALGTENKSLFNALKKFYGYMWAIDAIKPQIKDLTEKEMRSIFNYLYKGERRPILDYANRPAEKWTNVERATKVLMSEFHPIEVHGIKFYGTPKNKMQIGSDTMPDISYQNKSEVEYLDYNKMPESFQKTHNRQVQDVAILNALADMTKDKALKILGLKSANQQNEKSLRLKASKELKANTFAVTDALQKFSDENKDFVVQMEYKGKKFSGIPLMKQRSGMKIAVYDKKSGSRIGFVVYGDYDANKPIGWFSTSEEFTKAKNGMDSLAELLNSKIGEKRERIRVKEAKAKQKKLTVKQKTGRVKRDYKVDVGNFKIGKSDKNKSIIIGKFGFFNLKDKTMSSIISSSKKGNTAIRDSDQYNLEKFFDVGVDNIKRFKTPVGNIVTKPARDVESYLVVDKNNGNAAMVFISRKGLSGRTLLTKNSPSTENAVVSEGTNIDTVRRVLGDVAIVNEAKNGLLAFENSDGEIAITMPLNKSDSERAIKTLSSFGKIKEKSVTSKVNNQSQGDVEQNTAGKPSKKLNGSETGKNIAKVSDYIYGELTKIVSDKTRTEKITKKEVSSVADKIFKGTKSEGKYFEQDTMEAFELAVNRIVQDFASNELSKIDNESVRHIVIPTMIEELANNVLFKAIPTQTARTKEQDEYQQFSTPPHLAGLVAMLANVRDNSRVLEPSAGTGSLMAPIIGYGKNIKFVANEFSKRRQEVLGLTFGNDLLDVTNFNAEHIGNLYKQDGSKNKDNFDVVVMNPPFSATAGRIKGQRDTRNAIKHINSALSLLKPGGRLVAIVGDGMNPTAQRFQSWFKTLNTKYTLAANIGMNGKDYAKYGTTYDNRILVVDNIENTSNKKPYYKKFDSVKQALDNNFLKEISNYENTGSLEQSNKQESNTINEQEQNASNEGLSNTDIPTNGGNVTGNRGSGRGGSGGRSSQHNTKPETTRSNEASGKSKSKGSSGKNERNKQSTGNGTGSIQQSGERVIAKTSGKKNRIDENDNSVFAGYTPTVRVDGSKRHPANVVESKSLASAQAPEISYELSIPKSTIESGALSDAQLEVIARAGHVFEQSSNKEVRDGFLIGDGTGMGKGREIAGVIMDAFNKGDKKAIWLTKDAKLVKDIPTHTEAIGLNARVLTVPAKYNVDIDGDGILGLTYSSIIGQNASGEKRLDQIMKWLGKDFDGIIAMDEAHIATDKKNKSGVAKTKTFVAITDLKENFPKAKILYSSATIASNPEQMSLLDRLKLWGEDGSSFKTFADFASSISSRGVGAMEVVTVSMKSQGKFAARTIGFDGVKYRRLVHKLTQEQRAVYSEYVRAWATIIENVDSMIADKDPAAKAFSRGNFWAANQRFWSQVITSMQTETAIADMEKQLSKGNSIVIQLTDTGEAAQKRALEGLEEGQSLLDVNLSPSDVLSQYLKAAYPIYVYEEVEIEGSGKITVPVTDGEGKPLVDANRLAERDRLIKNVKSIRKLSGALDIVLNHFGVDNVAEVTGRSKRLVWKDGKKVVEKLSSSKRISEIKAFQDKEKRILIFSGAGNTGGTYSSDLTFKNQEKRMHYVLQSGWRASEALQSLGRTNRANQANNPEYILVTTDVPAQARFISTIAMRLEYLGALTTAERKSTSGGLFSENDNLESRYAVQAAAKVIEDIFDGKSTITVDELNENLKYGKGGELTLDDFSHDNLVMRKLLNRLLSTKMEFQNKFFSELHNKMGELIDIAKQAGKYDDGTGTIKTESTIELKAEKLIKNGKPTNVTYHKLESKIKSRKRAWDMVQNSKAYWLNPRAKKHMVYALNFTNQESINGRSFQQEVAYLSGASGNTKRISMQELEAKWKKIEKVEAKKRWNEEYKNLPKLDTIQTNFFTGALLNTWNDINGASNLLRIKLDNGETYLGIAIPDKHMESTMSNFDNEIGKPKNENLIDIAMSMMFDGEMVTLNNGMAIGISRIRGEERIEIKYIPFHQEENLKRKGVFFERLSFKDRAFFPVRNSRKGVMESDIKRTVEALDTKFNPRFLKKPVYSFEYLVLKYLHKLGKITLEALSTGYKLIKTKVSESEWFKNMKKSFKLKQNELKQLQMIIFEHIKFNSDFLLTLSRREKSANYALNSLNINNKLIKTLSDEQLQRLTFPLSRLFEYSQAFNDAIDEDALVETINRLGSVKKYFNMLKSEYYNQSEFENNDNSAIIKLIKDSQPLIKEYFDSSDNIEYGTSNKELEKKYSKSEVRSKVNPYLVYKTAHPIEMKYAHYVSENSYTSTEKEIARLSKETFGLDAIFYYNESKTTGVFTKTFNNKIFINRYSDDIVSTFSHEFTHWLNNNHNDLYNQLKRIMLKRSPYSMAFQRNYGIDVDKMSDDGLASEIVAVEFEDLLRHGSLDIADYLSKNGKIDNATAEFLNLFNEKSSKLNDRYPAFVYDVYHNNIIEMSNVINNVLKGSNVGKLSSTKRLINGDTSKLSYLAKLIKEIFNRPSYMIKSSGFKTISVSGTGTNDIQLGDHTMFQTDGRIIPYPYSDNNRRLFIRNAAEVWNTEEAINQRLASHRFARLMTEQFRDEQYRNRFLQFIGNPSDATSLRLTRRTIGALTANSENRIRYNIERLNNHLENNLKLPPLTEEQIRSAINLYSIEYLVAKAAYKGYKLAKKALSYGIDLMSSGINKLAQWSKNMIKKFGESIQPHIKSMFADAKKVFESRMGMILLSGLKNTKLSPGEDRMARMQPFVNRNESHMLQDGTIQQPQSDYHSSLTNVQNYRLRARNGNAAFRFNNLYFRLNQQLIGANGIVEPSVDTASALEDVVEAIVLQYSPDKLQESIRYYNEMVRYNQDGYQLELGSDNKLRPLYSVEYLIAKFAAKGLKLASKVVKYGIYQFKIGVKNFAKWSNKMIAKYGDSVKEYLNELHSNIKIRHSKRGGIDLGDYQTKGRQADETTKEKLTFSKGMKKFKQFAELFYKAHSEISKEKSHFLEAIKKNKNAKSVEELIHDMATDVSRIAEQEKERLEKIHIREDNSKFLSGLESILKISDKFGDTEMGRWIRKKARSLIAPMLMYSEHQKNLFRIAERMWWNGSRLVESPGFRTINDAGDRYHYEKDAIPQASINEYFNNLTPIEQQMLQDRAMKNEEYRKRQVDVGNPIEILRNGLEALDAHSVLFAAGKVNMPNTEITIGMLNSIKKLNKASNEDMAYYKWSKADTKEAEAKLTNILKFIKNAERKISEGKVYQLNSKMQSHYRKIYNAKRKLVTLALTNMGHFGYAHHTGFESLGAFKEDMSDYNSAWHTSTPATHKYRSGKEGFIENLFNADMTQNIVEGKSRAVNKFLKEVELTYGVPVAGITTQEELNQITNSDTYNIKNTVVGLYGETAGKKIALPNEVYDLYIRQRDGASKEDSVTQSIVDAAGTIVKQVIHPLNYSLLNYPSKATRDLTAIIGHIPHVLWVELLDSKSIKESIQKAVAFAKSIRDTATPTVWNKITKAELGEYSESQIYTDGMGVHWTTKLADKMSLAISKSLKLENKIPLGSLISRFFQELDMVGGADIPIKRMLRLYAKDVGENVHKLSGNKLDRYIRDTTRKYAFDTKDLPPVFKFIRGQMPNNVSKVSGMIQSSTSPFFGWFLSLAKAMTVDSIRSGIKKTKEKGFRYGIPDFTVPLMFMALSRMIAAGLMWPFKDKDKSAAHHLQGARSRPYQISTAGRAYIGEDKKSEYHIWMKSIAHIALADAMSNFVAAMVGMGDGREPLQTIIDPASEMVTLAPVAGTTLSLMGYDTKFSRYNKKSNQILRLLTMLALPQSARFGRAISKIRTMQSTGGAIPDERKMSGIESIITQLGGKAGTLQRDKSGEIIKRKLSNELAKELLGINIKQIQKSDIKHAIKREYESLARDAKAITDAERWKKNKRTKLDGKRTDDPYLALKYLGWANKYRNIDNAIQKQKKLINSRAKSVIKSYNIYKDKKDRISIKNKIKRIVNRLSK